MKELGNLLKEEREKQGHSLEDMASRTKIHIQKIIDIENGNLEALPAKVFCIGLIKSYARELKIDSETIDNMCLQAFSVENTQNEKLINEVPLEKENSEVVETQPVGRFQFPKIVGLIVSVGLCALLVIVIFQVIEKMNSYSREEALPQEVFIEPNTDKSVPEEPKEEPAEDKVAETQKDKSPIQQVAPKLEEPKVESKPAPAPKPKVAEEPESDFVEDNFGAPDPTENSKPDVVVSDNKLTLIALEPVRTEVIWSDGYVQVMLLKSQESKTLVFSQPIKLRINNGGAVQVSFNDGEKKVPGTFNQPIELTYP